MATCVTARHSTLPSPDRVVRILRWTFRRDDESVVCELGLNGDDSSYELRLIPSAESDGHDADLFDDAMSAFQRQAAIERSLVDQGWMLEAFESERFPTS
jgi:hypothetical protein